MSQNNRAQCEELNYFNAIACLLVMLIHILSIGITYLEKTGWQMAFIFFPYQLSAFVVPGFLFTGAMKLGIRLKHGPLPYGPYILRREQKIYVPYLFWVVVYYIVYTVGGRLDGSQSLLYYILTGMVDAPFYYIIIVMQFYLLMPLWNQFIKRIPWYVAIPLSALVSMLMLKSESILSPIGADFLYADRLFPTYLLFWVTGLYAGAHYEAIHSALGHWKIFLWFAVGPLIFSFLSYRQFSTDSYLYNIGYLKLLTDCMSIFFLLSICTVLTEVPLPRLRAVLSWIHQSSFTVYLSHCLFMNVVTALLRRIGITSIMALIPLRVLFTYSCAFLFYAILSHLKKAFKRRNYSTVR